MRRTSAQLAATLIVLSGLAYACGSTSANSGFDPGEPGIPGLPGSDGGAFTSPSGTAGLAPLDNAVILVHAAKSQAFRLCFQNQPQLRPQPDSQVMPEANVVGVEVGSAVRLGPLAGPPGHVYLFEEPLIRAYYPAFGGAGAGPTCENLLSNTNLQALAQDLGAVHVDLSNGVHLLVVRGCPSDSPLRKYSLAECGEGWVSATGNLTVQEISLSGTTRASQAVLPAQVVNLSQPLESARAGRGVLVTFGDLTAALDTQQLIATDPGLFGNPTPLQPSALGYDSSDAAVYESVGVRVSYVLEDGGVDGAATDVLDESLASIQKQSSPRDIPPTYYAAASNYALLLLGDPNAKLADGGPDSDERRVLHLLAVPVVAPKADAGSTDLDAGAPATH